MECRDLKREVSQGRMANSLYDCERVEVEQVMQDTKMDAGGEKKDEKKRMFSVRHE